MLRIDLSHEALIILPTNSKTVSMESETNAYLHLKPTLKFQFYHYRLCDIGHVFSPFRVFIFLSTLGLGPFKYCPISRKGIGTSLLFLDISSSLPSSRLFSSVIGCPHGYDTGAGDNSVDPWPVLLGGSQCTRFISYCQN